MVFLDPNPVLFSIGPLEVRWYGIFAAIMFLGVYLATPWLAKRKFGDDDTVFWQNAVIVSLVTGLIGARLLHVILAWHYYAAHPIESFEVWKGGLTTHGGIIGAGIGLWFWSRMHGRHVLDVTDTIVVPFAFSLSLGRVGNIMNSEILGDPCPGPWPGCPFSFSFARDPTGVAIPRVPVQFYAIVQNLVIGTATAALYLTTRTRGIATAGWLTLYGALRFIVEFYRAEPLFLGPLDMVQTFTIPVLIGVAAWFVWLLVKERRIEEGKPDAS